MKKPNHLLDAELSQNGTSIYPDKVPLFIYTNLKKSFGKRPYQQEAFGRFVYYMEEYRNKPADQPMQLLYHMATGSGKTVVMAGLMIYLYSKGYRNFLFFVNSTNIIEKTKDNFANPFSSKYLFAEKLAIGEKRINIHVAENFETNKEDDITLVFTTIQGLHARLNTPRENAVTYEDFRDRKMVLISDEAHHINAETKKGVELDKDEKENLLSWEGTVNKIFRSNRENILLEFTATIDLTLPEIERKYAGKLLFDYPLKQFRKDGYSKEVKILQADLSLFDRALQALLLSQYRQKVFERNRLQIKPVILFKSKTIRESQAFYAAFIQQIKTLDAQQVKEIKQKATRSAAKTGNVLQKAFRFFEEANITPENLALELKEDFSVERCIVVNSKEESEQKQMAINTLEEEGNPCRAVFAVDKLNEGWDVLNLFDIVRLYDTRDVKNGKPGRTTVSEAQLIGRGARYCPFRVKEEQTIDQRKFDDDVENEMRICEELYYHSTFNPRYIQELNTALTDIGIKPAVSRECHLKLKEAFKEQPIYKKGFLFLNERIRCERNVSSGLDRPVINQVYKVRLSTGLTRASMAYSIQPNTSVSDNNVLVRKVYSLSSFGVHVIKKGLNRLPFYRFSNLKKRLPDLTSAFEFITSENYLGGIKLEVSGLKEQVENLSPEEKLQTAIEVLQKIAPLLTHKQEYRGTKSFRPFLFNELIRDKTVSFPVGEAKDKEAGKSMMDGAETSYYLNLQDKEWYAFEDCFGTAEKKKFIHYIDQVYCGLKASFNEVYLIKNERYVRFYHFDDGRAAEPDFILLLIKKNAAAERYFQIFINVEESSLLKAEERQESFLKSGEESRIEQLYWDGMHHIGRFIFRNNTATEATFEKELHLLVKECDAVLKL